jgi:hypothetical protein
MTSQIFYWSILCFDHLTGILSGYSNFMHDQHCIHHFENGDKLIADPAMIGTN